MALVPVVIAVVVFVGGCERGRPPSSPTTSDVAAGPGTARLSSVGEDAGPVPPAPEHVAQVARTQVRLPPPALGLHPADQQRVGAPIWLWLRSWSRTWTTVSIAGVSVTVTARPVSVTWSMGDGALVSCAGPGTPYRPVYGPAASSPDCGYAYPQSSTDQPSTVFEVTATVRWSVTWAGAGHSGTLEDLTSSQATQLRVVWS